MSTSNDSLSQAEKFLESLNLPDSSDQDPNKTTTNSTTPSTTTDRNDIMDFLDEISNYSTEGKQPPASSTSDHDTKTSTTGVAAPVPEQTSGWMSWGNSLLAQASQAVKTTTDQINRTVQSAESKHLLEERVKHLQTLVNKDTIEKLGTNLRQLTTQIMETVAPPISEHELVEVWLTNDRVGYQGVEALVYRAFARVMDQTETGQVVVRQGTEGASRDWNMTQGVMEGIKLAKTNIDQLIKQHDSQSESTSLNATQGDMPVITCPVYMAIQPTKSSFTDGDTAPSQLVYVIVLEDPTNKLSFQTYSQSIPLAWLDIPYEENEWVEDKIVDVLRMGVTTLAQDYVWTRMTGGKKLAQAVEASSKQQDQQSQEQKAPVEANQGV